MFGLFTLLTVGLFLLLLFGSPPKGRWVGTAVGIFAALAGSGVGVASGGGNAAAGTALFGMIGFIVGALIGNHAHRSALAKHDQAPVTPPPPPQTPSGEPDERSPVPPEDKRTNTQVAVDMLRPLPLKPDMPDVSKCHPIKRIRIKGGATGVLTKDVPNIAATKASAFLYVLTMYTPKQRQPICFVAAERTEAGQIVLSTWDNHGYRQKDADKDWSDMALFEKEATEHLAALIFLVTIFRPEADDGEY